MSWFENLRSAWTQGPGWDFHDLYDWVPGVESGEEKARMQNLRAAYGALPEAPRPTQVQIGYMNRLREMSGMAPGAGYQQTPLYKGLMSDVGQQSRRMGWESSAQQGRSGVMSGAGYGPGRQLQTERGEAVGRLQQQAASQAWQAQVQAQEQEFRRVLAAAGFDADIQSADWERKFRLAAARIGLAQAEIEAAVERQRTILGLVGNLVSAYALYKNIGGAGGGGGGEPGGGVG